MNIAISLATRLLACVALVLMASGCGQKGPLVLPSTATSTAAGSTSASAPSR